MLELIVHNYFDGPIQFFSDLYLVKFLDTIKSKFCGTIKIIKLTNRVSKQHRISVFYVIIFLYRPTKLFSDMYLAKFTSKPKFCETFKIIM